MSRTNNINGYTFKERLEIRKAYENKDTRIKYRFDWKFSPIENQCWSELRSNICGRNFYPEYPIGRYFADFADPKAMVVIECDSKQYHQDSVKDLERQQQIEELGWKVLRFTSSQILSNYYERVILSKQESGDYEDNEECQVEIEANKDRCIGCYFHSNEFVKLFKL